jgi:hypothetical protein
MKDKIKILRPVILIIGGIIGWALCGAVMFIGMSYLPIHTTLIIHLVAAPIFFMVISIIYFKFFNYTTPLLTALIFVDIVIFLDAFIVALLINKSFDMFASLIGTWIPFILIFLATYLTGLFVNIKKHKK